MRANASCTVIKTSESLVIVDTLTPWDGPFILQLLNNLGFKPEDFTHVVSTHCHSDHIGNNNLFVNTKQHIAGFCVSNKDVYFIHPFDLGEPYVIDKYITVIPTPGHTSEDVTVLVNLDNEEPSTAAGANVEYNGNSNSLAIAGDLFENEDDILKPEIWTASSFNPDVQVTNRLKVLKMAKIIIPGHGKPFEVRPEYIKAASDLVLKYQAK